MYPISTFVFFNSSSKSESHTKNVLFRDIVSCTHKSQNDRAQCVLLSPLRMYTCCGRFSYSFHLFFVFLCVYVSFFRLLASFSFVSLNGYAALNPFRSIWLDISPARLLVQCSELSSAHFTRVLTQRSELYRDTYFDISISRAKAKNDHAYVNRDNFPLNAITSSTTTMYTHSKPLNFIQANISEHLKKVKVERKKKKKKLTNGTQFQKLKRKYGTECLKRSTLKQHQQQKKEEEQKICD